MTETVSAHGRSLDIELAAAETLTAQLGVDRQRRVPVSYHEEK
ncbi:hypothetical protein [Halosimplex sp. TS25]